MAGVYSQVLAASYDALTINQSGVPGINPSTGSFGEVTTGTTGILYTCMRFPLLGVLPGAVVTPGSAQLAFRSYAWFGTTTLKASMQLTSSINEPPFLAAPMAGAGTPLVNDIPLGEWPASGSPGGAGTTNWEDYLTLDTMSLLVQEFIDRAGYCAENYMGLILGKLVRTVPSVTNYRSLYLYHATAAYRPTLSFEFTNPTIKRTVIGFRREYPLSRRLRGPYTDSRRHLPASTPWDA